MKHKRGGWLVPIGESRVSTDGFNLVAIVSPFQFTLSKLDNGRWGKGRLYASIMESNKQCCVHIYTHTRVYNAPLLTVDRQPTFNNRPFHVPNWSSTLVKSLSIVSKALERYLISRSRHDYRAPHEKRTNLTKLIETTCSSPHTSRPYILESKILNFF